MTTEQLTKDTCVVRNTASTKGRTHAVVPGKTATKHLHYGRIILGGGDPAVRFENGEMETGLICLKGTATVRARDQSFTLGRLDSVYVPRDSTIEVTAAGEGCDLAELAAPVSTAYPIQFVPFEQVKQDPGLHLNVGSQSNQREVNILIGKNVDAGRILAGVTFSAPGNWTSWPPHEHAAMLEEAYLYFDMPAPSFGLQLVYTNTRDEPEIATVVRDGDVVLMPAGYHPNVAAPGGSINFLWMMAANREREDRKYGVVNVQPEFAATPTGLDRGR
jgi:5-deoxy-glucuronate isomerase